MILFVILGLQTTWLEWKKYFLIVLNPVLDHYFLLNLNLFKN